MAVITISRQVAALGDEVGIALAEKLGYKFIGRKVIEQKLLDLGFSAEKLNKYDERKPGFFAALTKNRDEYLHYLQTAIFEAASEGNCVLIGRGSFIILEDVPNIISIRLVASNKVRLERLMKEFSWTEKQAQQRIDESDSNRLGFHKSFFNLENDDPVNYHVTLNTGLIDIETAVECIADVLQKTITPQKEQQGAKKIAELLAAQRVVSILLFEYKLPVNFLHAVIDGDVLSLHGVADSAAIAEQAVSAAAKILPEKKVKSCISIVQDFKPYS
ncbi:MAG: cytidylate kinase-like family protein [Treponema sp.]|jgi:cytidylate kinase|nr:cytidylate kinase-like family protein [Treponema sp.]